MNHNKSLSTAVKLPLVIAVGSLIAVGCSSKTAVQNPSSSSTIQTTSSNTQYANVGVATNEAVSSVPATDGSYSSALLDEESFEELANLLEATDMTMVEDDKLAIQRYGDLWDRMRAGFAISQAPYQYNARIEAQKSWFTTRQDYINRLTARASRYLYHTVKEAERRNIPTELALLPVIESSYDPTATSNASAAGMWQFIPSTGRIYGLTQTPTYDGRRDVVESTRAAYDFLTSLYNQFGSWELALAAYNAGPGRVQRAIDANRAKGLPTDFWSLNLPKETMNYVPRFLAVAQIVNDANKHGIYLPAIANRQHFRSVPVKYGVALQSVSQITGQDYQELKMLNPALISDRVDIAGPNRIIIPNSVDVLIDAQLSQLTGIGAETPYVSNVADSEYKQLSQSAEGLAEFATKARAPAQNDSYIMPTQSSSAEPQISESEKQFINSQFASFNTLPTTSAGLTRNATIVQEPPLSPEEKAFIAAQIQSQTPEVGEVVSPIDGNVKLEAVQTQQSILAATGQEKKIQFDSPKQSSNKISDSTSSATNNNYGVAPPSGKRTVYTVQRGDTLSSIAAKAGLSWRDIADWNQINPNSTLTAGTKLYLYNARPITQSNNQTATSYSNSASQSNQSQPNKYTVRSGDTLIGTANRVGLSVSQLARYNGLSTNARLKKGQTLWLIPGMVKSTKHSTPASTPSNQSYKGKTQKYTVKRGESLNSVSRKFNISISMLAKMNNLNATDGLLIGQRLNVPATSVTSSNKSETTNSSIVNNYTVQSGDTLIGIANKLSLAHTNIAKLNNIAPTTKLQKGQVIKLPVDKTKIDLVLNNKSIKHKVRSGETLSGVAKKYNVSISSLASANKLSTKSHLVKGKTLIIPNNDFKATAKPASISKPVAKTQPKRNNQSAGFNTYTVKRGDTLIGIAKKFGISTSKLANANGLTTKSYIKIGQTLKVPATTTSYKVVSGDNLIKLSKRYGITTKQLADLNGIKSDAMLKKGQTLTVPVK